jgi:hypothetical protein
MKKLAFILLLLVVRLGYANDGAYYVSGNQLVPVYETDIAVAKEILSIQKLSNGFVRIVVNYEFFNPKSPKTIEVGFEARSPSGDVDGTPIKGRHPNISEFTVNMNGQDLPYLVAIVEDSLYYKNGKFVEKTLAEALKSIDNANEVNFNYVYHFKANFKQGLNKITHTYLFQLSSSVEMMYELPYILTAAKRWANRQIDDFTLKIDMGSFADFYIQNSFFDNAADWKIEGTGKKEFTGKKVKDDFSLTDNSTHFWLREGTLLFQKKNFAPQGEINLFCLQFFGTNPFNAKDKLPLQIGAVEQYLTSAEDEAALKILRNLPFARRGYIFKTPDIQQYYEKMDWYMPNPSYQADLSKLTKIEQDWLKKISK